MTAALSTLCAATLAILTLLALYQCLLAIVAIAARRPPERPCLLVSAETGEGIDELLRAIEERLAKTRTTLDLSIDAADGAGISWLHRNAEVLNKQLHDGRFDMTVRVDETKRDIVVSRFDAVPHGM